VRGDFSGQYIAQLCLYRTTITQSAGPSPSSISGLFGEQPSGGAVTDIKDLEGRVGQVETSLQTHERDVAKLDEIFLHD